MDTIFKENISNPQKITDTNFKDYFPNINADYSWSQLLPYIKQSYRNYMAKYISPELLQSIKEHLEADPFAADVYQDHVIDLLRTANAYYTIYAAMPHINIRLETTGANEHNTEHSTASSQWRFKGARWECLIAADKAMDDALQYMHDHQDEFADYASSGSDWFITSDNLKDHLNISGRRAFLSMLPFIKTAEDALSCIIGDAFYAELKALEAYNTYQSKLIFKMRSYIADHAFVLGIPRLSILIDGDGLKLVSNTDNFNSYSNAIATFGKEGPAAVLRSLNIDVKKKRNDIMLYLNKNKDEFVTWRDARPVATEQDSIITTPVDCIGGIGIG